MNRYFLLLCLFASLFLIGCGQGQPDRFSREIISTDEAPAAIGPYSQAVLAGNMLFISGQIPLDPETGELVGDDITGQTVQVMENLGAVLSAAGLGFGDVVTCSVFMTDLNEFQAMNEVYGRYFSTDAPSRATVEVSRLPRDVKVEISAIAIRTN
jgi:2-iminobutanoate/2-iminopropanoate deaminase